MAQEKTPRLCRHANITQSQSLLNVAELETRAKATVKDINELYAALQDLVPKTPTKNPRRRGAASATGTDTDTARSSDDWDQRPRIVRRYHSEKFPKKQCRDNNANYVAEGEKPKTKPQEKLKVEKTLSNERLFASDTEVELNNTTTNQQQHSLQRHLSLPAYDDESANEATDGEESLKRKSKFSMFHRHRHRSKPAKKKGGSSWRSFFSTLSLKRHKSRKNGKKKVADESKGQNQEKTRTSKQQAKKINSSPLQQALTEKQKAKKNFSVPLDERSPKPTSRLSFDLVDNDKKNFDLRKSQKKRIAPEPPSCSQVETPITDTRERRDTMETKSDAVQKKLSAWYKHVVNETNNQLPKDTIRATRSCENLLTDTEIIRKRGTFSSDTESGFSAGDKNRVNVPKTRVRKTRAKRNRRRKERGARFHSLPNVKLVTKALNESGRTTNTSKIPADCNDSTKDELTDEISSANHVPTVKPLEAKLSFGSTLEGEEPITNFMKLQKDNNTNDNTTNGRNWLTRQASRTTIGCIRPLQLSLFFSESPSRETVHRSRSIINRPRLTEDRKESGDNMQEFAFKIRRSSSRRRKRRSFKRGQSRLPHQSPFYVPPSNHNLSSSKDPGNEDCFVSKDSGLGSPDVSQEKKFTTFPDVKEKHTKLHSESEDSGWASSYRHLPNKADTGIQTDPVIVMTAVSRVRRPVLPQMIQDVIGQSEV